MYKLMKRIYLLLSLLLCSLLCMSQVSTSQNYISTRTYTSPDQSGCREQVVYFDGLGRPSQTVDCGITPDRKDLVSLQEYDDQGRKLRTWLPAKSAEMAIICPFLPYKVVQAHWQVVMYVRTCRPRMKPLP